MGDTVNMPTLAASPQVSQSSTVGCLVNDCELAYKPCYN